jgi:transposase-like protein
MIIKKPMPKGTRKQYTPEFKFKLVQESIKDENMTSVARKYSVNFTLLAKWKSHFLEHGKQVFEGSSDKEKEELKKKVAKLEQIIGKKEIELNLIKNFSDFYESQNMT